MRRSASPRSVRAAPGSRCCLRLRVGLRASASAEAASLDARRFFLNEKRADQAAAFDPQQWAALALPGYRPEPDALVVLGVDGARFDDAVAVVACEVETGYMWRPGLWERPDLAADGYEHPADEIDGVVRESFDRFDVWRVYIDPHYLDHLVEGWQRRCGDQGGGGFLWAVGGIGGTTAMLGGMVVAAPLVISPLVAAIALPLRRLFPTTGRLAADAAQANPRRTAATAFARRLRHHGRRPARRPRALGGGPQAARGLRPAADRPPLPGLESLSTAQVKSDIAAEVNKQFNLFNSIVAIAILVSLLGVVNTLTMSVLERAQEIGVLRALGASRWHVRWTMVVESLLVTISGTIAGLLPGLLIAWVWSQ
jgi:hypothetical protein